MRDQVHRIRRSAALSVPTSTVVRVTGERATTALDRVLPCDVWLRDGQVRPTVLLDVDGTVQADLWLACDGDDWLVVADGVDAGTLIGLLRDAADGDLETEDLGASHAQLAIDGPFAWALLAAWDDAGAVGLPYLSFYVHGQVRVTRAGKTGEYGYHLLFPRDRALGAELEALGRRVDVGWVDLGAIGYCALENGFLDLRSLADRLDPRELQLQWRIQRGKRCRGADALDARPRTSRTTGFRAASPVRVGDPVTCDGREIGRVLIVAHDAGGPGVLGLLLLAREFAVAGIDGYRVGATPIRTVSVPMVRNRSLYLRPQRHTWADEPTLPFPYAV